MEKMSFEKTQMEEVSFEAGSGEQISIIFQN